MGLATVTLWNLPVVNCIWSGPELFNLPLGRRQDQKQGIVGRISEWHETNQWWSGSWKGILFGRPWQLTWYGDDTEVRKGGCNRTVWCRTSPRYGRRHWPCHQAFTDLIKRRGRRNLWRHLDHEPYHQCQSWLLRGHTSEENKLKHTWLELSKHTDCFKMNINVLSNLFDLECKLVVEGLSLDSYLPNSTCFPYSPLTSTFFHLNFIQYIQDLNISNFLSTSCHFLP